MAQKKQIKTVVEAPLTKVATEVPIDVVAIAGIALACVALLVGVVSSELSLMQGGAGGGASSTPAVCIEDKSGQDYFQAGYAYGYNTSDILATATDKCYDIGDGKNDYVQEYFCTDAGVTPAGRKPYITVSSYHCPDGCSGGACVTLATNTTPTITPLTFSPFPNPSFYNSKVSLAGVTTTNVIANWFLSPGLNNLWPLFKFTVSNNNPYPITVTHIKFDKYGGDLPNLGAKFASFKLLDDNKNVLANASVATTTFVAFDGGFNIPANTAINLTLTGSGFNYDSTEGKYFIFKLNNTDISVASGTAAISGNSFIQGHKNVFMDYIAFLVSNSTGWKSDIASGNYVNVTTSQFIMLMNSNPPYSSTISYNKLRFIVQAMNSSRAMTINDFGCAFFQSLSGSTTLNFVKNATKIANADGSFTLEFSSATPLFTTGSGSAKATVGYLKCNFSTSTGLNLKQLKTSALYYDDFYVSPISFQCSSGRPASNMVWSSSLNPSLCYDGTFNPTNKKNAATWTINWK